MVLRHEPPLALFIDEEEYESWFHELLKQMKACLNPRGVILMEGHEDKLAQIKEQSRGFFSYQKLHQDYTSRTRFIELREDEEG